ncbi:unnamed protein product, partial [Heterotrigona itama]
FVNIWVNSVYFIQILYCFIKCINMYVRGVNFVIHAYVRIIWKITISLNLHFRLAVNKISITRGSRAAGFYETNETTQMQTSPTAIIEDASTSPSQDIDNKLKTLQIQSRS